MTYLLAFVALFIISGAVAITMFVRDERAVRREKSYRSNSWTSSKGELALYACVAGVAVLALSGAIYLLVTDPVVQ